MKTKILKLKHLWLKSSFSKGKSNHIYSNFGHPPNFGNKFGCMWWHINFPLLIILFPPSFPHSISIHVIGCPWQILTKCCSLMYTIHPTFVKWYKIKKKPSDSQFCIECKFKVHSLTSLIPITWGISLFWELITLS